MFVCTAAQMREIDRQAIEELGIPGVVLMEAAGRGIVALIAKECPVEGKRVAVLCGSGNNGGDGYVAARHLIVRGADPVVYLVCDRARVAGDALVNLQILERMGAEIRALHTAEALEQENLNILRATIVIDALLGTGLNSPVRGILREVIQLANRSSALRVAVDIPSGLHADTGEILGVAFSADITVTLAFPKLGLVTHPGVDRVGRLHVVDLGLPLSVPGGGRREFAARLLDSEHVGGLLHVRPSWGHKGTYGHLLLIAGSRGKTGAALLAAEAALRSGTGLCTIAAPPSALDALEAKTREAMLAPICPPRNDGQDEVLDDSDELFARVDGLLEGKTAVALGPGILCGEGTERFVERLVRTCPVPLAIDADGLNELAPRVEVLREAGGPIALTPHPREMSRLCGLTVAEIQAQRLQTTRSFARRYQVALALKGARTIVGAPDGRLLINPTGSTALATAGTGDVLTGIVGGLLAQGYDPTDALAIAVYVHGAAGDRGRKRHGERGLIAGDLLQEIGGVFAQWEEGR
jgi:NAD(P)H-hydrate epimerase